MCHFLSLGKRSFFLCIPLLFTSIWCLLLLSMCSLEKHTHVGNFISHFCENILNCSPTPKLLSFNPEPQILCYLWNLCIGTSTWPVLDSSLKNKRKQNEVALTGTRLLGSVTKLHLPAWFHTACPIKKGFSVELSQILQSVSNSWLSIFMLQ